MSAIYKDIYQFSSYIPPIDLSFHKYLLLTDEPLLVHTGTFQYVQRLQLGSLWALVLQIRY